MNIINCMLVALAGFLLVIVIAFVLNRGGFMNIVNCMLVALAGFLLVIVIALNTNNLPRSAMKYVVVSMSDTKTFVGKAKNEEIGRKDIRLIDAKMILCENKEKDPLEWVLSGPDRQSQCKLSPEMEKIDLMGVKETILINRIQWERLGGKE